MGFILQAQGQYAHFIRSGSIEYERRVNLYALVSEGRNMQDALTEQFFEAFKRSNPQFHTSTFRLQFTPNNSLYEAQEVKAMNAGFFGQIPWLSASQVFTDFNTDSVQVVREIYQENYAYQDQQAPIIWKLTNETREIAGFSCRRANGLIQDSIYVVAFYSTELLPPGGPETFSGLPGMILGIALPHEHVTWFATKVEERQVERMEAPEIDKKTGPMDRKTLESKLEEQIGSWGSRGQGFIRATLF